MSEIFKAAANFSLINHQRKSVVLRTVQKSGTNYLRLVLSNYFWNLDEHFAEEAFEQVSYQQMHNELFPNVRSKIYNGKSKLRASSAPIPAAFLDHYADFLYDHGCALDFAPAALMPKKMILLYRNPLDQMVSWYFFKYKDRGEDVNHPKALLEELSHFFVNHYTKLCGIKERMGANAIMVSYEQLTLHPTATTESIISFLGLPIIPTLIQASVVASSIKSVRQEEKSAGGAIHQSGTNRSSFIRSGKIGDWKNYFGPEEVQYVDQKLQSRGYALNRFNLHGEQGLSPD